MNITALTDKELIEYVLKFDDDPVRVRLAKVMDRMPGFILQRLEDVGMDPETCLFENNYDPGDWIRHLEGEIDYMAEQVREAEDRAARLEAMTVLEFMDNVRQKFIAEEHRNNRLETEIYQVKADRDNMQRKLDTWTILAKP